MAITIDYSDNITPQYVIQIPRLDMLDVTGASPTEIRELDLNTFRQNLANLGDDAASGIVYPTSFMHTAPLTVAGVVLARVVEILTPFVILFEDGLYNVNVVGGNSNIADRVVKNQVGVNTANSAGATVISSGSGLSIADIQAAMDAQGYTTSRSVALDIIKNRLEIDNSVTPVQMVAYADDDVTETFRWDLTDIDGNLVLTPAGVQAHRGPPLPQP